MAITIIMTHENADFDSIAALCAANRLYPDATPVLPRHLNRNIVNFLTMYGAELPLVQANDLPRRRIQRVILVDTQAMVTIRGMSAQMEVQIIDHHPLSRELAPGWTYSGQEVGATTTLLVERIVAGQPLDLSPIEATLFLMGIYEDTGSLSYLSTTPRDVQCAAWLLEHGARLDIANDFLHYPLTADQRALSELLIQNSETHTFAGQQVVIAATEYPRYVEEVSVLAHRMRDLFDPAALFLLVQFEDQVQMIARSSNESINVGTIAAALGGGGHSQASAALIRGMALAEVKARLLRLLETHIRPAVTVRQIMSFGVRTVEPTTTVAQAVEWMQLYGHEGFPVLDQGRVVGILSRRETDRAMRLGLGNAAISMYMTKGPIQVRPDDAVETLQQVMMDSGVGQVPVVSDDGTVLGIVTRTDLINLLLGSGGVRDRGARRQEIASRLEQMIPEGKRALLRRAAEVAQALGYPLYIVGGFVRDLLLSRPNLDIDLVVEGDAIALACQLADAAGGRVRSHARFGTAKWILHNGESLDFVTARTEFYPHPTALPKVESSSIKQDLHRRDFTINTLAIRLDGDHYGELLDFYGGEQDLKDRVIRVLHSLSFVEDPTRILRAIRLEQRLGFRIEPRTQELIANAQGLLARVTGERIRHELFQLLAEPTPESGLARMEELDVLRQIHPGLRYDGWVLDRFQTLRQAMPRWYEQSWRPAPTDEELEALHGASPLLDNAPQLYLALLAYRPPLEQVDALCDRLRLSHDDAQLLRDSGSLRDALRDAQAPIQAQELSPSQVVHLLAPYSGPAILVNWVACDSARVREQLSRYWEEYRLVKPVLTGDHLRAMGLPPGPIYGRILEALRDARLDGRISSEEEERAMVAAWLAGDVQGRARGR